MRIWRGPNPHRVAGEEKEANIYKEGEIN